MQRYLIFTLFVVIFSACGSELSKDTGNDKRTGSNPGGGDGNPACTIEQVGLALQNKGFSSVDINKLTVMKDGKSISLCNLLLTEKADSALLQFAGVTCGTCIDEAKYFQAEFAKESMKYGDAIHVVALTDRLEDYPEEAFEKFMNKNAPTAVRVHDINAKGVPVLWKHFSVDPVLPVRPTIIAFNKKGQAYLINEEGAHVEPILEKLAELKIEGPEDPSTDPLEDDDLPALELKAGQNFKFKTGNNKDIDLASLFTTEYLIIDFSQYNCTYCRQLADKHQKDTEYQALMSGKKCRDLTVIPQADMNNWIKAYPFSSFVGRGSIGTSDGLYKVATKLGIDDFAYTPTVMILNRKGELVGEPEVGGVPASVKTLCKE